MSSSSPQLVPALSMYFIHVTRNVFLGDIGEHSVLNVPAILSIRYLGFVCNFPLYFQLFASRYVRFWRVFFGEVIARANGSLRRSAI